MSDFHSSRLTGYPKTSSLAQGLCCRHAALLPLRHMGLRHHRAASLTHRQLGGWVVARLADSLLRQLEGWVIARLADSLLRRLEG